MKIEKSKLTLSERLSGNSINEGKWVHYLLFSLMLLIISFSALHTLKPHLLWSHFNMIDYPLHSSVEALGAIAAILMAFMPLHILFGKSKPAYVFISLAFLMMGILDLFHSFYKIGNGFVFTHSMALLSGGLLFSLIIFPWKLKLESARKYLIISAAITSLLLVFLTAFDRSIFPEMIHEGNFTATANRLNIVAGILFFVSAIKLITIYFHEKHLGILILIFIAISSGVVGITFQYSEPWSDGWWLWHIIRLIAFLATLAYTLGRIQKVSSELNVALNNLNYQYVVTAESEKKFKSLLKSLSLPLCLVDNSGKMVYMNDRFTKDIGYTIEDIPTLDIWWEKAYPDEEYRKWVLETWHKAVEQAKIEDKDIESVKYNVTCKNGQIRRIIIAGITTPDGFLATLIDITEETETRLALEKSEERYNLATTASNNGIWDWNLETNETYFSDQWKAQLGYKPDELKNDFSTWEDLLHPDFKESMIKSVQDFLANPSEFFMEEFKMMHKDGTPRWIYNRAASVQNKEGNVLRMFGSHSDITELKKKEVIIRKEKEYAEMVIDSLPGLFYQISPEGKFVRWNKNLESITGYSSKEMGTISPLDLYEGDEKNRVGEKMQEVFVEGQASLVAYLTSKDGKKTPYYLTGKLISIDDKPILVGMGIDITERKKAEESIKQSEANLKIILNSMPFGSMIIGKDKIIKSVNKSAYQLMGYDSEEEIIGKKCNDTMCLVHKENCPIIDLHQKVDNSERILLTKSKKEIPILKSVVPVMINNEEVLLETFLDITKLKDAENALKNAKEYSENLINTANAIVVVLDSSGNVKSFNRAAEKITGYTFNDLTNKNWFEVLVPKDRYPKVWEEFERLSTGGIAKNFQNPILTKSGEEKIISWQNSILQENGDATGIISFGIDITEQSQAAKKILESEMMFKNAFNKAAIGRAMADPKGNFVMVNKQFADLLGYSDKELMKMSWPNIMPEEYLNINFEKIGLLMENKIDSFNLEQTMLHKDGTKVWVHLNVVLNRDLENNPTFFVADIVDLSDMKKAQNERDRFFDITVDLLCIAGTDGYFKRINPSWTKIFGWSEEEFLTKPFFDFIHPDDVQSTTEAVSQLSEQNPVINFNNRYKCKDGSYRWLTWVSTPVDDTIYAAAHDITDMKIAEKELLKSNAELETFNKLAVGRELTMIQLKKTVNQLSEELGKNPIYDLSFTKDFEL